MRKIVICDDEQTWLDRAGSILERFLSERGMDTELELCSSIDEIPEAPDVVFMDIEFGAADGEPGSGSEPEANASEETGSDAGNADDTDREEVSDKGHAAGIAAAAEINRRYPDCQVVYLTNYLNYAVDVYETEHVWYLLKEQFEERLPEVMQKISDNEEATRAELVVVTSHGSIESVRCRDILYLERKDRRTVIVTYRQRYEVRDRIPVIMSKLPARGFARCHNSYAVNLDKVSAIQKNSILMKNGDELLISRGYGRSFRTEYMDWAGSRMVR